MNKLHKSLEYDAKKVAPKEGQRGLLCSNRMSSRCPSLGFDPTPKDKALAYLADVLVNAYLEQRKHEPTKHTN
jgi:hypothetical protein